MKGARYLRQGAEGLAKFIVEELPFLDYKEAQAFYEDFRNRNPQPTDVALLGCNDRFFFLTGVLRRKDALHPWLYDRCREVEAQPDNHLDLWARYHYKALALDTPVLTPKGWTTHGALKVGDQVYGPDGNPRKVMGKTVVFEDAECFEIVFDSGEALVCSAEHLWTLELSERRRLDNSERRTSTKMVTIDTRQLNEEFKLSSAVATRILPRIRLAKPMAGVDILIPLTPYALGVWLGDGTSAGNIVTAGYSDAAEMQHLLELDGYVVTRHDRSTAVGLVINAGKIGIKRSSEFTNALRKLGVLGNKHIPEIMFKASEKQRWALLQGLMDTDGSCHKKHGQAIFCNANESVARDFYRLASSLGLKATFAQRTGLYKGERRPYWQVQFRAFASRPPFRMARKVAQCSLGEQRQTTYRRIVSVRRCDTVPVSCIQVDHPDGLYVVGEQCVTTHNSTIITFAGILQELCIDPEITCCIFSHTRDIASAFLRQIKAEMETNELLKQCYPDVMWYEPAKQSSKWSEQDGLVVKRRGNPKESSIEAWGLVDAQPTSKHFGLLVYDDVVTKKNVTNADMVKKTTEAWELSDNLGKGEGTRKWHAGTRYSFADTYGQMIERKILKVRLYPATDTGRKDGNPVFMSKALWEKTKKNQLLTLNAQMLQNPAQGADAMFDLSWLKTTELRPTVLNVYIMGDPSKGKTQRSDRTAIAVVGLDAQNNKYLLDGVNHRMPLSERWVWLRDLYKKWVDEPGVQNISVGWERYGAQTDDEYFAEQMEREKFWFTIGELAWPREGEHSKDDRVSRLQPDFVNSKFYLPAFIWHETLDPIRDQLGAMWSVDLAASKINIKPLQGQTKLMRLAEVQQQNYRIIRPIKRLDETGSVYDLTRRFIDEYTYYPFSQKKDLIDAVSRFYDMQYAVPNLHEQFVETMRNNHPDA